MRSFVSALAVAVSSTVACAPPPDAPTADDGAAHLGLVAGTTKTYASSTGATETHEHVASDILLTDGLSVGLVARENGFAKEERSLTFGVDLEGASIVRFFSCLNACATASAPIPFVAWPLEENVRTEGEAIVTVSENGAVVETRTERHATTVGTLAPVTVPAGTFDAFVVSWSRTLIDAQGNEETETAVLQWAPDVGIVKHDTFDGVTLELQSLE
jgi:hypothetical protein